MDSSNAKQLPQGLIFGKSEVEVRAALALADPNVLRMALYQATRDPELATLDVDKLLYFGGAFEVPALFEKDVVRVREKAFQFLRSGADADAGALAEAETRKMMELMTGSPINNFIYSVGRRSLVDEEFPLGVEWNQEPAADVKNRFHVLVVGAGFAGLSTAIQLERLGIPYTVVERNAGAGGTWWINNYPDARVDTASHEYQLSFMKKYRWKDYFAKREELLTYVDTVIERYKLRSKIRFNTSLVAATWNDADACWHLVVRSKDRKEEKIVTNALISAAGLFNAANMPDIPGVDDFKGKIFHTTQWDHSYDYTGKGVAQIGVGSSGVQLMPALARKAKHLTVYQRSPQWLSKIDGYLSPIPDEVQWLLDNFPYYWNWYCFSNFMTYAGGGEGLFDYDRDWQKKGGIVSKRNDALRQFNIEYAKSILNDRPDLLNKVLPEFAPWVKRPVVDSGFLESLKRENVELVTESIARITPKGILTTDGIEREFDLIALCSGFGAERFLWPVQYVGRGGLTLERAWEKDGARAYLSMTVPEFPNLFIIYGPNGQIQSGGGLIKWLEIWSRYAVKSVVQMIETGTRAMSLKPEVFEEFNKRLDEATAGCIWESAGKSSYYVNKHGRSNINGPWHPPVYYEWAADPNMSDYELIK